MYDTQRLEVAGGLEVTSLITSDPEKYPIKELIVGVEALIQPHVRVGMEKAARIDECNWAEEVIHCIANSVEWIKDRYDTRQWTVAQWVEKCAWDINSSWTASLKRITL